MPVGAHAAGVRQHAPRLARHVGAHVPRPRSSRSGWRWPPRRGGAPRRPPASALGSTTCLAAWRCMCRDQAGDPFGLLLQAGRHVAQRGRRRQRHGGGQQVGVAVLGQAHGGADLGEPLLAQASGPPRPRMSMRVSAPVPASKPVARMITSSACTVPSASRMPSRHDLLDRIGLDAHRLHVRPQVGFQVVAFRAAPGACRSRSRAVSAARTAAGPSGAGASCSRTNSETSSLTFSSKNISA